MKTFFTLYRTTNNINGKIYIGVHKTNDVDDGYIGSGKYLQNAINKYGIENFTKEIIKICLTEEEMFDWERLTITKDFVKRKDTYNICEGGKGGFSYINENNLSISNFKNPKTQQIASKRGIKSFKSKLKEDKEFAIRISKKISTGMKKYIEKNGALWTGRKHTKETKEKMSQAKKDKYKGKNNPTYGTCWVYNIELKQSKRINKEELNNWIEQGWCKGRKIKF